MIDARGCDRCGAPTSPSAALDALCPACLLRAAALPGLPSLKILTRLGTGPSSVAYLAEDPRDPARLVVLKRITPLAGAGDAGTGVAELREGALGLAHRHIARVLELSLGEERQPYAVTEFWPGIPVTRYLAATRESAGLCDRLFAQINSALHHAHARGLVHGALTAANVLVARTDGGPAAKILDFGHAALAGRLTHPPAVSDDLRAFDELRNACRHHP